MLEALVRRWQPQDAFRATPSETFSEIHVANGMGRLPAGTLRLSQELERPSERLGRKTESLSRPIERTIKLLRDLEAEGERAAPTGQARQAGHESAIGENEG